MFLFIDLKCISQNQSLISCFALKTKEQIDDMPQIEIEIEIDFVPWCYEKKR